MPTRRPRCSCGDLFSEHDWHSQNARATYPCAGPVCSAMYTKEHGWVDPCESYEPDAEAYRPLRAILGDYGLKPSEVGLSVPRRARGVGQVLDRIAQDKFEQSLERVAPDEGNA